MEPIHFGDSKKPLFGTHHRASGAARRPAVLLCPSWGMEYMRAYRGQRLLAMRLAEAGYETLRFDYSGTGDSEGPSLDARLDHWLADIGTAARELRDLSGTDQLVVFGLRFGCLLAEAARVRNGLSAALHVSWDAPASGAEYVALMQKLGTENDKMKQARRNRDMQLPPHFSNEMHAHAWPTALAEAVTALPGITDDARRLWVTSRDVTTVAPTGAATLATDEAAHWHDARWIGTPWIPAAPVARIVEHLKQVLP